MVGAICYKITDKHRVKLYLVGTYNQINWDDFESCDLGDQFCIYRAKENEIIPSAFRIEKGLDDEFILRLFETKRYILKVECDEPEDVYIPRIQNEGNKFIKCERDKNTVTFQFINYLGRSKIIVKDGFDPIRFEIIPDKMDYEQDYIALTESLADVCAGLLLEFSGATSNLYKQCDDDSDTILEQFIFLRQFCYGQNLQGLFESVKRNPDRILTHEEELKPVGMGRPSTKFYTNPFSHSRAWTQISDDVGNVSRLPQMATITRKYDSLDTPANRFIKFALHRFDDICVRLMNILNDSRQNRLTECYQEAIAIHRILEIIFQDSFFDTIGELDIMPQNNQVLQKREGYSHIFFAYSMLDLALQLDWKGKDEVYEGESKNVALLYEYWLFFELYKVIRSIEGEVVLEEDDKSFLTLNDGVTISLEEGKKSYQSFHLDKYGVTINLYYNRTFSKTEFRSTCYEGSYSRPFRPDYTLAVFPDFYRGTKYNGETEAIKTGDVSYIHFDAKYRITDLTAFVGARPDADESDELENDKTDAVVNTYKRGDLLKMHTYNDAIRRTIGSYVLYPGNDMSGKGNAEYRLFDEILPGVGAFSIKPSNDKDGEAELRRFIISLIEEKDAVSTRLNRMNYYNEMVIKEPSSPMKTGTDTGTDYPDDDKMCVLGYIRAEKMDDYYYHLKEQGLLREGAEFLFYFYAIKGGHVYSHHKDVFRAAGFRFYNNDIRETDSYQIEPVLGRVIANELITKHNLVERLNQQGYSTRVENHFADYYYALTIRVWKEEDKGMVLSIRDVNGQNGNDTFSPHSPKIISMG